jgi:hypothetical protein
MASQDTNEPLPGSNGQPTATIRHGTTILRQPAPEPPPSTHSCGQLPHHVCLAKSQQVARAWPRP